MHSEKNRDNIGSSLPPADSNQDPPLQEPPAVRSSRLVVEGQPLTGAELKALREELGLTQKEFAAFVDLPLGTISTWERRGPLSAPAAYLIRSVDEKTAKLRTAHINAKLAYDETERAIKKALASGQW